MKVKDLHSGAPGTAATGSVRTDRVPLAMPSEVGLSRRLDVIDATIRAPALRAGVVPRGPLVSRLRRETAAVVTIVAPAGYGKTTLLAQWAVAETRPVAWLTAGARDNAPRVLLDHLVASLDRAQRVGRTPRAVLREVGRPSSEPADSRAADAVAAWEQPFLLVIDNADLLQTAAARRVFTGLASRLPRGSTIALGARSEPRLNFASLRARGGLRELGVEELALTRREAQLLLQATDSPLPNQRIEELIDLCEGWPAALYLASLSARGSTTEAATGPFGGADRYLVEYLQAEYLPQLRPGDLRFLRRAAVMRDLTGPRCDAVLEEQESEMRLQRLARANVVVAVGGDGGAYRLQRLLRQFFLRELVDAEPDAVPALHRRAADWYARAGRRDRELDHAEAAGDAERVAALLGETVLRTAGQRSGDDVACRLARLDRAGQLARHPDVALQAAWIHATRGRAEEAERLLAIAEHAARRRSSVGAGWRAGGPVVRAALCRAGARRMLAEAGGAAARLPRSSQWYPLALHMRGCATMLLGAEEQADAMLAEAASAAEVHGAFLTQMIAVSQQSVIALWRDDRDRAAALACDASEILSRADLLSSPAAALALAVTARTQLRLGRWADARELVDTAEPLRAGLTEALPWLAVGARLELGSCYATLRDVESARAVVCEIEAILEARPGLEVLALRAAELRDEVATLVEEHARPRTDLTRAERRLLPLLATHLSFREIGEQLDVSRNTVKTQAISIYRKLGVKGRSDAIAVCRSGAFGAPG